MNEMLKGINNLDELLEKLGMDYIIFEQNLFSLARHFSKNYDGAIWESNIVLDENGEKINGFYLSLDDNKEYLLRNSPNELMFNSLKSKTFALVVFSMTTNYVGYKFLELGKTKSAEIIFELNHFIRNNIEIILDEDEEELVKFFKFID
jgi:hypothetical protein